VGALPEEDEMRKATLFVALTVALIALAAVACEEDEKECEPDYYNVNCDDDGNLCDCSADGEVFCEPCTTHCFGEPGTCETNASGQGYCECD
jgi:hypothetical protein